MADVDALVREQDARPLARALAAVGFVGGGEEYPHQLPALTHPHLGSVELHRHLPGVRGGMGRRRFATLDDVDRAGLLAPWPGMPAGALLPAAALLTAHLLAHGLAQHGFRPTAYPPLRLIGDLIDLGIGEEGGRELLAESAALLSPAVAASEARAAATAATRLAAGDTAVVLAAIPAGVLLRHLLGGVLDPGYQRSLKLRELVDPLGEGGRLKRRVASLRQALTLSRGQVDSIYGRPRNGWGYATRRALRPFDLAWRAGRALLS
jgi:hypothetical protein